MARPKITVAEAAAVFDCPDCATRLHKDCWQEVNDCPTLGCSFRQDPSVDRSRAPKTIIEQPFVETRIIADITPSSPSPLELLSTRISLFAMGLGGAAVFTYRYFYADEPFAPFMALVCLLVAVAGLVTPPKYLAPPSKPKRRGES